MRGSTAGLSDGDFAMATRTTKNAYHSLLLHLVDMSFTSLVCGPLVVSYWRGTWNLSSEYLYPHDKLHSSIASLVIGIIGHLVFTIFQGTFKGLFDPNEHRLTFYIGSRLYTSIFAIICVNTWKGGWQVNVNSYRVNIAYKTVELSSNTVD